MNISQEKSQKRFKFTPEEDNFLRYLMKNLENFTDYSLWQSVAKSFKEKFPSSNKTNSQLKQHYHNCLMKHSRNGELSLEEKELFVYLREKYQKPLSVIAKDMNRTYQSIKNYYYRHYQSPNKKKSEIEVDFSQIGSELLHYQNDYGFYGLNDTIKEI
jgi:hypothetical protein